MNRFLDGVGVALLVGAGVAFTLGVLALTARRDLVALYYLIVGALVLRAAVEVVRPRGGVR